MFNSGFDEQWIVRDVAKDQHYQAMWLGSIAGTIRDTATRRTVERMQHQAIEQFERIVAASERRARGFDEPIPRRVYQQVQAPEDAREAPFQAWNQEEAVFRTTQGRTETPGEWRPEPHRERAWQPVGPEGAASRYREGMPTNVQRGWSSPIPHGRGAYEGATEQQNPGAPQGNRWVDERNTPERQTGYRAVPRFRGDTTFSTEPD